MEIRFRSIGNIRRTRSTPLVPTPITDLLRTSVDQAHARNRLLPPKSPRWKRGFSLSLNFPHLLNWLMPILTPTSPVKRAWEIMGILLMSLNLLSYFSKVLLESPFWFFYIPATDLYFLCDIAVRFRTGFIDKTGKLVMDPCLISQRYFKGWFFLDCLLSIPYHFLFLCWQNTASLRLWATVHEKTKRPILSFFRNRQFRIKVLQQFREFWVEKRAIQIALGLQPRKRSLPRRTLRLVLSLFRVGARMRMVVWWTSLVKTLHSMVLSIRTVSVYSRISAQSTSGSDDDEAKEESP